MHEGTDPAARDGSRDDELAPERPVAWIGALVLVLGLGAVVPWVIAQRTGALGVARGDDWSYLRTLFHWVDTGRLSFNNWVSMTLLGQLVAAAPVAAARPRNIAAAQTVVTAFAAVGLVAVVVIGRVTGRTVVRGVVLALCIAALPFWGALSTNFMTDVPACAVSMLALAIGLHGVRRDPVAMHRVYLAIAIAVYGFTIREYAAIPVVALLATTALALHRAGRRQDLVRLAVVAGCIAVGAVLFLAYWRTIPDPKALDPHIPTGKALLNVVYKCSGMPRLAGLALAPVLILLGPVRIVRRAYAASADLTVFVALGGLAWFAYTAVVAPRVAFAGNYFVPDGLLGRDVSAGVRPDLVPMAWFSALIAVGTAGAVLLLLSLVPPIVAARRRGVRAVIAESDLVATLLGLALAGYAAAYLLAAATGLPLYDRYTLPAIVVAGGALYRSEALRPAVRPSTPRHAASIATLIALGCVGIVYTVDSASFDAARWHAAQAAVHAGWAPRLVGGNFEWVNYWSRRPGSFARKRATVCVAVIVDAPRPEADRDLVARTTYHPPFHDPIPVLAVRTPLPCQNVRGVPPGGAR